MKSPLAAEGRVDLQSLVQEFYPDASLRDGPIGRFETVSASDLPTSAATLLDHDHHMTVTLETHHGGPVTVVVHRDHTVPIRAVGDPDGGTAATGELYCREITLRCPAAGDRVVLYGLVALDNRSVDAAVYQAIRQGETPLGRVLIDADVLRRVERKCLWRIVAGPALAHATGVTTGDVVYGRTAVIYFGGFPAIELLEVIA